MCQSSKSLALVAALALAFVGDAWTQPDQRPRQPQPPRSVLGYRVVPRPVIRPDLTARIDAFLPSGARVPNGGVVNQTAATTLTIRVTVRNISPVPVTVRTVTAALVTGHGFSISAMPVETPPIPPGGLRSHEYRVPCPFGTNPISVIARADDMLELAESNEANNAASYRATISIRR